MISTSIYQFTNAIGLCMGWNGSLVAGETVANAITAIALLLLSLQLLHLIISEPNSIWTISRQTIVRGLFIALMFMLSVQKIALVVTIFTPSFIFMSIVDTICTLLAIINCVMIRQLTVKSHKI